MNWKQGLSRLAWVLLLSWEGLMLIGIIGSILEAAAMIHNGVATDSTIPTHVEYAMIFLFGSLLGPAVYKLGGWLIQGFMPQER